MEYLGKRVGIDGGNREIHNCVECGARLSLKDYRECQEVCVACRYEKGYSSKYDGYIDNGINNVDQILSHKLRGDDSGEM